MYEKETSAAILKRMLDGVSPQIDKREGSIIYDTLAPVSIEIELLYALADWLAKNTFGDTAERDFLIERALERGLKPYKATAAVVKGKFTPKDLALTLGTRFSCEEVNYFVSEKVGAGEYLLTCETTGVIGNKPSGQLVPIDYNQGLKTGEIVEIIIPAIDDESTEAFRKRYLDSFETQAYGGNIADYKKKIGAIAGVGGVKVYPVWQGGGTVRLTFCTSEFAPPRKEFVDKVQELVDPIPYQQQGVGIAPIGHRVTVQGVTEQTLAIKTKVTVQDDMRLEDVKPSIQEALIAYIGELNRSWPTTQVATNAQSTNSGIVVRLAQIEGVILGVSGVIDVEQTSINGYDRNVVLDADQLAKLGAITYAS